MNSHSWKSHNFQHLMVLRFSSILCSDGLNVTLLNIKRTRTSFTKHQTTGWPKSKFSFSNGYNSETKLFWPHVGKAKMCLRDRSLFTSSAICLQFFKKSLPPPEHILALPIWGQKSLVSELQPFEKGNFDLGHPVIKNVTFT